MLARKIALNTIISGAARVIGTLLALVAIGLTTRYLTKTEWGEYSIMLTFGSIFAVLADGGFYQLLVREISRPGADEAKVASNIFTMKLFISFFIFALAPLVSIFFPYSTQACWGIAVGIVGFWFLSGSQVFMGIFQKYLRMDRAAIAELVGRLVQLVLIWLFIRWQLGFLWIVATLTLGGLVNFILIYQMAQKHLRVTWRFDFDFWRESFKQSYPLAISGILVMIYFSFGSLILSVFRPVAEVGIYRLAYKVLESLIFFPSMFVGLIMPILSSAALDDWARFKNILQKGYDVLMIFALPLVLGTPFVAGQTIKLLGGGLYPESIPVLNILIVAVGIIFFGTLFSFGLIALGRQKSLLWISAAGAVINLLLNFILIPRYSYTAAAIITVGTELLVTILMAVAIWRTIHYLPGSRVALKSLLAALVMAAALWFIGSHNLLILLAVAAVVYFGVLYLVKGISVSEVRALIKKSA
ncbi:MAG TPA: hypothetical protein DHI91_00800 [Candidatus Portnoybacteria bacterium]|nr:hypothetical protein [Candidatus Portnoybacteria bacterium]